MSTTRNPTRAQLPKLALIALAVAAFVMVCARLGKTGPTGLGPQRIRDATAASSDAHGSVVADSEGERLLFMDSSGQLVDVYGLDDLQTPITTASVIHQVGEDVYVAGTSRAEDGEGIKTEAVLKFTRAGELAGTVWKKDYNEGHIQTTPTISDVTTDDAGNLILVRFDRQEGNSLHLVGTVTKVAQGEADQVLLEAVRATDAIPFEIRYDPAGNRCAMTDFYGRLYVGQRGSDEVTQVPTGERALAIQAFDMDGDTAVLYDEQSHALVRADSLFGTPQLEDLDAGTRCDHVELCDETVTTVTEAGTVRVYDLASGTSRDLAEAPLARPLATRQLALLLSWAYLVTLCVVLAARWLVRSIRQGRRARIKQVIAATATALACAAAMAFHLTNVFDTTLAARQVSMSQIASQASVTSPAELGDAATSEARREMGRAAAPDDGERDLSTIFSNVEGILASSFASGGGVQCTLYATTEDGEVRYLFPNGRDAIVWSPARGSDIAAAVRTVVQEANTLEGTGTERAYRFVRNAEVQTVVRRDRGGNSVVSCIAPLIAKDGTCLAAIEVSCHTRSLLRGIMSNVLAVLLVFMMTAASIFIVFEEVMRSGGVYLRYRQLREEGVEWAGALMGRPLAFAANLAFGMDAALAVIIAKDVLARSDIDSTALVMGIPALAITMGAALGTLAHAFLSSRVPGRTYALPTLLLGVASQPLCFLAVANGWFAVFVVCHLVSSASLAMTHLVSTSLATSTHSKDLGDRNLSLVVCDSSVNLAGKGASVVAGVVGGALAYVGDQWVYLAGAVVSVAVIPFLLLALPKGRVISSQGDRANLRNALEFLRSPIMLVTLAFGILPTVLAGGYKSYILPLFLDSAGVSKTDISCLFALGNAILYGFSDALIARRNAHGRWVLTWVGLVCLGVLFALFAYNQAPTWAMVSVVVITLLAWLAGDWKHNARGWAKEDYGFVFDQSQSMLNIEESVVKNAQAPVLTALLSLGTGTCCLMLGIFFAFSGVCYYLPTRNRAGD